MGHIRQGGPNLETLLASSLIFLAVISSVTFGVLAGYLALAGMIRLLARRPRQAVPVLAPANAEAAGD